MAMSRTVERLKEVLYDREVILLWNGSKWIAYDPEQSNDVETGKIGESSTLDILCLDIDAYFKLKEEA